MKACFVYWDPHRVHKTWAESAHARFRSFAPLKFFKTNGILLHLSAFFKGFFLPRADVYLLESPMMVTALLPRLLFGRKKVIAINSDPFFFSLRGYRGLTKCYFDWTLRFIDGIISTSALMANAAKTYPRLPQRVRHAIVPIFIDTGRFAKLKPATTGNFCFIGPHVNNQKGADRLITLFKALNIDAKLFMIGNATPDIAKLAKTDSRIVITGKVPNYLDFVAQSTYYFNLARLEPAGANILEAMAAGFVPMVSKNCGVAPVVAKLNPALIVDPEKDDLVRRFNGVKVLMSDPALSKKARTLVKAFNQEASVKKFRAALAQIGVPQAL
jgi:glycosyltransferase involved in cell wall biosynthesis